jgi:predicted DsbA family dithiol-disulfide isomerase
LYPPKWKLLLPLLAAVSLTAATCNKEGGGSPQPAPAPKAPAPAAPAPAAPAAAAPAALPSIPGMDFSALPAPAQKELATVLTDSFCYCGCPHSLGACLRTHGGCKHAKRMALLGAREAAAGAPGFEITTGLEKYYQSFREPRRPLNVDERQCKGPKDAPVTVVEFADFECPYCGATAPVLAKLVKDLQGKVRVCYAPFPLQGHANAIPAGQAALFARDKGRFWEMHDLLFENQTSLSPATIKQLATQVGLNAAELQKAFDEKKYLDELNGFKETGKGAGVDATPTLFINGRKYVLSINSDALAHTVEDEQEWAANKGAWQPD